MFVLSSTNKPESGSVFRLALLAALLVCLSLSRHVLVWREGMLLLEMSPRMLVLGRSLWMAVLVFRWLVLAVFLVRLAIPLFGSWLPVLWRVFLLPQLLCLLAGTGLLLLADSPVFFFQTLLLGNVVTPFFLLGIVVAPFFHTHLLGIVVAPFSQLSGIVMSLLSPLGLLALVSWRTWLLHQMEGTVALL